MIKMEISKTEIAICQEKKYNILAGLENGSFVWTLTNRTMAKERKKWKS